MSPQGDSQPESNGEKTRHSEEENQCEEDEAWEFS